MKSIFTSFEQSQMSSATKMKDEIVLTSDSLQETYGRIALPDSPEKTITTKGVGTAN
jgi:hypothetical protein